MEVLIPEKMTNQELQEIIQYRAKGRIPILSFVSRNKHLLWRSSQPRCGFFFKKVCFEDEMMLHYLGNPLQQISKIHLQQQKMENYIFNKNLHIYDMRSQIAKFGNSLKGFGTENTNKDYLNCSITFCNIANIHAVKNSYNILMRAKGRGSGWIRALHESK